jgi:hypothetical protein
MTPCKLTFATWFAVALLSGSALAVAGPGSGVVGGGGAGGDPVHMSDTWSPCGHAIKAPVDPKTGSPIG